MDGFMVVFSLVRCSLCSWFTVDTVQVFVNIREYIQLLCTRVSRQNPAIVFSYTASHQ